MADLAVDTRNFGGATTTQDTLWRTTPTAMVPTENMVTRAGPSALEAIGVPSDSCSVESLKEYEDLVVGLVAEETPPALKPARTR